MKILLFSLMILSCSSVLAQHPDDYRWDDRFSLAGIFSPGLGGSNSDVFSITSTPDYVVVGGNFTVPGIHIALWNLNTNSWEKAGKGVWKASTQFYYPFVRGVFADGDSVFVWGNFSSVDDTIPASNFAILNPRTKVWTADTMLKGEIGSITRFGNDIIINGSFSITGTKIQNIARWNAGKWSEFSTDTTVITGSMVEFKGTLYSTVRYVHQNNFVTLAKWNGASWIPIFDSITPNIQAFTIPIKGLNASADYLYIYGAVDSIRPVGGGFIKVNNLARFDGTSWTPMLDVSLQNHIQSIALHGDDVFIAGDFSSVNGIVAEGIARWNNSSKQWSSLGSGIPYDKYGWSLNALTVTNNTVFIGGTFPVAGGQLVNNIARYDLGSFRWNALGDRKTMAPIVTDGMLSVFADNNKLLTIGGFVYASDKILNNIGYWNGSNWENIGTGIVGGATFRNDIMHLMTGPTGLTQYAKMGQTMYLGGSFEQLGAYRCDNITSYREGTTECVGGGIYESHVGSGGQFVSPAYLTGMQVIGSNLFVAGDFKKAGQVPVESIAQWDGKQWSDLGGGIPNTRGSFLLAQDSSGKLLVGGKFSSISGIPCNGLAAWNGKEWSEVSINPKDSVASASAVCVSPNGDLYVAGNLSVNGEPTKTVIIRKRGDVIEKIGEIQAIPKSIPMVNVMACNGDLMYVAGNFNHIGTIKANKVAVWNMKTEKWSALGSGFVGTPYNDSLSNTSDKFTSIAFIGDTVYFGGSFSFVGGKSSFNIAAWLPAKPNNVEYVGDAQFTQPTLTCAPNPSASYVNFQVQLLRNEHFTITIADALGRVVQTVADEYKTAGEYSIKATTHELSTGVYFARLVTESTVVTIAIHIIH